MKTLDHNERQLLLRKYMGSGLTFDKSIAKVNKFHDYLKNMQKELSTAGRKNKDIEMEFKNKFFDLCMKLER